MTSLIIIFRMLKKISYIIYATQAIYVYSFTERSYQCPPQQVSREGPPENKFTPVKYTISEKM